MDSSIKKNMLENLAKTNGDGILTGAKFKKERTMTDPIYTTLNAIREHEPCEDGWVKLLSHLGKTKADDEPLALVEILKSNGIADAIWCLRALPEEHESKVRLFNCDIAEHVLPIYTAQYPNDTRVADAIRISRMFANGEATQDELSATRAAAWTAAGAAAGSARAAADAAWDALDAADAAADAAGEKEREWQANLFMSYFGGAG